MNESIGKCTCGGTLRLDHHNKEPKPAREFRWEVYCDKCLECDPNGYSSREKAIDGGLEYFCAAYELDTEYFERPVHTESKIGRAAKSFKYKVSL